MNEGKILEGGLKTYDSILYSLGYENDDNDFSKDISEMSTLHFIREEDLLTVSWNSDYGMHTIPESARDEIQSKCTLYLNSTQLSSVCSFHSITDESVEFIVSSTNLDNKDLIIDLEKMLKEVTKIVEPLLVTIEDEENPNYCDDEGFYHDN